MEGFLSDEVRDLIAVLGIILAIVGALVQFIPMLSRSSTAPYGSSNSSENLVDIIRQFVKNPSKNDREISNDVRRSLHLSLWLFIFISLSTVSFFFIPSNSKSGWIALLFLLAVVAAAIESFCFVGALSDIGSWLKRNASSEHIRRWRLFILGCWVVPISLGVIIILNKDGLKANPLIAWVATNIIIRLTGLFIVVVMAAATGLADL